MRLRSFLGALIAAVTLILTLTGCATSYDSREFDYAPAYTADSDMESYCRAQAQRAYSNAVEHNERMLAGGAIGGAGLGAGIGSVSHSRAGAGALIGLGVGLFAGATQTLSPQREADRAYGLCVSTNRKHF